MFVGIQHLSQCGGEHADLRVGSLRTADHADKTVNLSFQPLAAGCRTLQSEAELKVFLIADQNIGKGRNAAKGAAQFLLAPFPEGGAVIEVKADQTAVFLGFFGNGKAGCSGFLAHGGDQSGQVQNAHAVADKDAVKVEIRGAQGSADLAGTVIPYPRRTQTESAVRDVELVPVSPGTSLRHFNVGIIDPALAQFSFNKGGNRTACNEFCHGKAGKPQGGGNIQHVGFRTGCLHIKTVTVLHCHPIFGSDPHPHAGGAGKAVMPVGFYCFQHCGISFTVFSVFFISSIIPHGGLFCKRKRYIQRKKYAMIPAL
ncbi:unknown [Clostridium sp. CAG:448]|nr:unknown [Clostridium sp. CAG:448]